MGLLNVMRKRVEFIEIEYIAKGNTLFGGIMFEVN